MPFTYQYRSSVGDLVSPQQEPLQDDSIVLSDLIRTGETSRLRRRGAMRIEPTGANSSRHRWRSPINPQGPDDAAQGDTTGYTWTIVENRSHRIPRHLSMLEVSDYDLEDYDSDSGDEMVFSASFNRAISEQTGRTMSSESAGLRSRSSNESVSEKLCLESTPYTLICGGPIDDTAFHVQADPESVYSALASFILPQSPLRQSVYSSQRSSTELSVSNGCGTVIHTHAFPRYRHHQPMWTANAPAAEVVVPLERIYFDDICAREKLSAKLIRQEACGCHRVGIGCANCGNPLGFQLTPCKTLREHIISRRSRLQRRHSLESVSSVNKSFEDQELHLYTFFYNSTSSPQTPNFPAAEPTSRRRREWSRPRPYPLLPPPPPLIRLMSDSEMSDSDEEVIIDFRTPASSSAPTRILDGDVTASPEPAAIHLEPNSTPLDEHSAHHPTPTEDSELGQARASWANVVRGVEAAASSLGGNLENQSTSRTTHHPTARLRRRRGALGPDAEQELRLTSTSANDQPDGTPSVSQSDLPSILFEQTAVTLTPPPPQLRGLPQSTSSDSSSESGQSTPRPAVWDVSFADGHPSTSFWGRPAPGNNQWTWSNELAEIEGERDSETETGRDNMPRRVFDPDGEFLEGLEGEWGEDMARRLGFNSSSTEEKFEGGEMSSSSATLWWS